jgi:protein involved in polysaccharide export with SLBB domain
MNRFLFASRAIAFCFAIVIGSILAGCSSLNAGSPGSNLAISTNSQSPSEVFNDGGFRIRKGDKLKIDFFEAGNMPASWEQVVREDGTIALPMTLVVTAEGKTKRELADDIHKVYVPKYFKRMSVNIKSDDRFYFVTGEVKIPGVKAHPGELTVTKAIGAAGDFTDFAQKKKIQLIRANGEKIRVNWNEAAEHPERDIPVYPGDRVHVPRRFSFGS